MPRTEIGSPSQQKHAHRADSQVLYLYCTVTAMTQVYCTDFLQCWSQKASTNCAILQVLIMLILQKLCSAVT